MAVVAHAVVGFVMVVVLSIVALVALSPAVPVVGAIFVRAFVASCVASSISYCPHVRQEKTIVGR
jgi:hypothetical protein